VTGGDLQLVPDGGDVIVTGTTTTALSATSAAVLAAANDNDTSVATTSFVQQEINGAGAAGLACASGACATASTEADFLTSGALTCGASTQGKMQVHTTPLQYCDAAATPVLKYAAYGSSTGVATSATALAADPADCGANTFATAINASGTLTCASVVTGDITDNTITASDLAATLTFADADFINLAAVNASSTTEGLTLPQAAACTASTAEGQICWDTDGDVFCGGTGAASQCAAKGDVSGNALTGDTATAFFSSGAIEAARGGTNIDTSASIGLPSIAAGTWSVAWPVRSIPFASAGWNVDAVQCTKSTGKTILTNGPKADVVTCTDNDAASVFLPFVVMPDSYGGGTITIELTIESEAASPSGNFELDWECQCKGSGEAFVAYPGTGEQATTITVALQYASVMETTAALTPTGTCAAGDILACRGQVDATATTATVASIYLLAAKIEFTVATATD
jgi:hypothetical protein